MAEKTADQPNSLCQSYFNVVAKRLTLAARGAIL